MKLVFAHACAKTPSILTVDTVSVTPEQLHKVIYGSQGSKATYEER